MKRILFMLIPGALALFASGLCIGMSMPIAGAIFALESILSFFCAAMDLRWWDDPYAESDPEETEE